MSQSDFRNLSDAEVQQLQLNGCSADDWSQVLVSGVFCPDRIRMVSFIGSVRLGDMSATTDVPSLGRQRAALLRTTIANSSLAEGFYVADVQLIAGYQIGYSFVAMSCQRIVATGSSSFGIGTHVAVVLESGGREVPLSASLSSNIAHVVALHCYKPRLVSAFDDIVAREAALARPVIGDNVSIVGCGMIKDVRIGSYAIIRGASKLKNGTILSADVQRTLVGHNVIASNFVFAEGAKVEDAASLSNVFVGQCATVANGFSADNVLAFANSHLACGEAVSVLAGPYTVSHHKSSLLIAGAYSFYNAGSATNSSNHLYRLGPTQQAVYARGSKTGSGSYVLQPANIGPFTTIVGHHRCHPSIAEFPFSILAEKNGESHLLVAQNLSTMGLFRDVRKWPRRDARTLKRDAISFDALNPLTVDLMIRAVRRIEGHLVAQPGETIILGGVRIRKALLPRAARAYRNAINYYLGRAYAQAYGRISDDASPDDKWVDCGGLVAPLRLVSQIEDDIISGALSSVDDVNAAFESLARQAPLLAQEWAAASAKQWFGFSGDPQDISEAAHISAEAAVALRDAFIADAAREWDANMLVSFGQDGSADDAKSDFLSIKGSFDENPDVIDCRNFFS